MATIYWGAINVGGQNGDGNWNTAANWFLTLGSSGGCCPCVPGTPAGRVPAPGDSVVLAGMFANNVNGITTGPAGGWAGPLSWLANVGSAVIVSAGTYTTTSITVDASNAGAGFAGAANVTSNISLQSGTISGGTYSGTVAIAPVAGGALISGGTFSGQVTRNANALTYKAITGGTYIIAATIDFNPQTGEITYPPNLPTDPGFAIGGGAYKPVLTVSGVPDILGTGLL